MSGPTSPRALWTLFEPVHAVTYFTPQARGAFEAAGLRGFWRGYFAGRAAPLGAVPGAVVTAVFYGFAPRMVERALPSVWELASPEAALTARREGAMAGLAALPGWGPAPAGGGPGGAGSLAEAAELARAAVEAADVTGRPLGAANAALAWPDEASGVLWHAATALRELRGDGHVAALLTSGLSGLDALVLRAGSDLERPLLQEARGWSDEEWDDAAAALSGRSLLDGEGRITIAGRELLADVEAVTDHLAAQPWQALGPAPTDRFVELVEPLARAAAAALPQRTPLGLPPRS